MRAAATGFLWIILIAGYHGQQKHSQPSDVEKTSQYTPPKSPFSVTGTASPEQKESAYRKTLDYLKKGAGPEFLAAWILVVAAGIGLYVTWRTAKAALLNAQAVINSERPWIDVTIVPNEAIEPPGYFFFRVTNTGRTPARFISGGFSHDFRTKPGDLPIPAMYAPFFAPNERFLAPDHHFDIQRSFSEATTGIRPESIIDERMRGKEPLPVGAILFFYGNIVYDDILGKGRPGYALHETRWCFAYFKNGRRFVKTGPDGKNGEEYNNYT